MHFSDEELVAYLDGELPRLRKHRMQRHLEACWHCRTRLAGAEEAIQHLTKEVEEWSFPGPGWSAEGKLRLNHRIREFESRSAAETKRLPGRWTANQALWKMAAAAALLVGIVAFSSRERSTEAPAAGDAITRAAAVEGALYTLPVRQTLAVEIAELRPARNRRSVQLEVWSDRKTGRFVSRLVGEDGVLKHAVWRPRRDVEYLYSPAVAGAPISRTVPSGRPLPLSSLGEYGLDSEQIEGAFLRWMEAGAGRAVSFTSELAVWAHQDGTAMKAELLRTEGASPSIRVTAQRTARKMTAVLRVDFEAGSYRPRLQTIRFETPERAIEFRLAAIEIKEVSSTELKSSLFTPEIPSFSRPGFSMAPDLIETDANLRTLVPAPSDGASTAEREALEAHYVLHQAGACLGEPVKIEQGRDGIHIRNRSREGWSQSFTSAVTLHVILNAFAELRDAPPSISDLPEGADSDFASATALRHAWALSRLAGRFPDDKTNKLLPEHWRLLETMVRDHVTRIDGELARFHLQQNLASATPKAQNGWRYSSSIIVEALQNAHELLRNEPFAKVAPLLQDIDAELHDIADDFSAEYLRMQVALGTAAK